jgi:hypothetical protein
MKTTHCFWRRTVFYLAAFIANPTASPDSATHLVHDAEIQTMNELPAVLRNLYLQKFDDPDEFSTLPEVSA